MNENNISFGQESIQISIPWLSPKKVIIEESEVLIPSIHEQEYEGNIPHFGWMMAAHNFNHSELSSYETEPALVDEIKYLTNQKIEIPQLLKFQLKITSSSGVKSLSLHLLPFVVKNGTIHRVTSLKIQNSTRENTGEIKNKSYKSASVLADGSGNWYKIKVLNSGIHKIDKSFLSSCGINTNNLNPKHIHIYGNGEGILPESNAVQITDDLAQNALYILGEDDNVFNDGDYILFYGWASTRWTQVNQADSMKNNHNIYSDTSYYFININASIPPLRIAEVNSSAFPATKSITDYLYYAKHELEKKSLMSGGQRWYGEEFETELTQNFTFEIPDINPAFPVKFAVAMASTETNSTSNGINFSVNSNLKLSRALPGGTGKFYGRNTYNFSATNPSTSSQVTITVNRSNPSVVTYLDDIVLNARRKLILRGGQFNFRNITSVGAGAVSDFTISNCNSSSFVWDVTNSQVPVKINGSLNGSDYVFRTETPTLKEFVVSDGSNFLTPIAGSQIANQNLHGLSPDFPLVIVTHPDFIDQAERLANLHRANNMASVVVTTNQIYNEFSSGMLDPTAIRRFAKMMYDRAGNDQAKKFKYLLLFGDGTFDPKNRVSQENYIPTYQVLFSENNEGNLVSDDYYGLLDDNEAFETADQLDVSVGRLLVSSTAIAKEQVDKIEHYMKNGSAIYSGQSCCGASGFSSTYGDWRLKYTMIADDYEAPGNFVPEDAEPSYNYVKQNATVANCEKLYLDAFPQMTTAGGQRYPDVVNAIDERMANGTLIMNYIGHGGEVGAAEERVITINQIQNWSNIDRLTLFFSATCEFTKYDDPSRISAGEWVSLNPNGGSIALMTTTRPIFISLNTEILKKFYSVVFTRTSNFEPLTFGEIFKRTKNEVSASDNKRCLALIGDPALQIALPRLNIIMDSINSKSPKIEIDTIRALSKVTIKGHIESFDQNILTGYNGILTPTIFDKPKQMTTLGQDRPDKKIKFELQKNTLFRGQVTVKNGYFEFSFIVPKDINYAYGNGKISLYADAGNTPNSQDASGFDTTVVVGGIDPKGIIDNTPPTLKIYLNNEKFADGGITNSTPLLIAKIEDENGINTAGNGIGHDLTAIIDGQTANPIVLNNYYTADLDSYQKGQVQYAFPKLATGEHTLTVKVWDINGNSTESTIHFNVQNESKLAIDHVLNYPNPFSTKTEFYFEHNQLCTSLDVQIQIFTISGKVVKTINETVTTTGFRSNGIAWDGKDEFGDAIGKGVYIYKMKVRTSTGEISEKTEKLVLLN